MNRLASRAHPADFRAERIEGVMTMQKGARHLDARTDWVSDPDGGPMRQLRVRSTGADQELLSRQIGATEFKAVGTFPVALRSALIQLLDKAGRSTP
jgi:hypothetical protein